MSVINRYISSEILKILMIVMVVVIGVYLAVDFFQKIDDFMEQGLPMSKAATYFLIKIPFIITQIFPLGLFLAVIITLGLMNRNNEIIALNSGGISHTRILLPVAGVGIAATIFLFFFSEVVVPVTNFRANQIWLGEVRKEKRLSTRENNIWIKANQSILHIKFIDPLRKTIFGVTRYGFDRNFNLIRRIDAASGKFQHGSWRLDKAMEQTFDDKSRPLIQMHNHVALDLALSPQDITQVIEKPDEMGFKNLLAYVRKIESEGYDATAFRVDLYAKSAFPVVCIILSLLGAVIGTRREIRQSLPAGVALGIGIAFVYWVIFSICLSLGRGQSLSPLAAAWLANLIFMTLAGVALWGINQRC